ncbi:MAG: hypothetical protein AAFU79_14985 [Myxococcota bacterium]
MIDPNKHPRWKPALEKLRLLLPGATDFIPDNIAAAAVAQGVSVAWVHLRAFGNEDDAVWSELLPLLADVGDDESVALVADVCYVKDRGPFYSSWRELREILPSLAERYGEPILALDVVIVAETSVLLVHHSGVAALICPGPAQE